MAAEGLQADSRTESMGARTSKLMTAPQTRHANSGIMCCSVISAPVAPTNQCEATAFRTQLMRTRPVMSDVHGRSLKEQLAKAVGQARSEPWRRATPGCRCGGGPNWHASVRLAGVCVGGTGRTVLNCGIALHYKLPNLLSTPAPLVRLPCPLLCNHTHRTQGTMHGFASFQMEMMTAAGVTNLQHCASPTSGPQAAVP